MNVYPRGRLVGIAPGCCRIGAHKNPCRLDGVLAERGDTANHGENWENR